MNSKELLLGLILVREGKLSKEQLKKALLKQGEIRRFGRHQRLGEIICKLGFMTAEDLVEVLDMQNALLVHGADHTPLGLLLIERGLAQPSQVYDALVERQFIEGRLGERLIEKGLITEAQLQPLLSFQEQERVEAASVREAEGLRLPELPPGATELVLEDDFVIFDAGGGDLPFSSEGAGWMPTPPDASLNFSTFTE